MRVLHVDNHACKDLKKYFKLHMNKHLYHMNDLLQFEKQLTFAIKQLTKNNERAFMYMNGCSSRKFI